MHLSPSTLSRADALPLECDGLTRVLSTLMQRDGVEHRVCVGELDVENVGTIPYHWWIALPDGTHCDFRARMWLGESPGVPHGVFSPAVSQRYAAREERDPGSIALLPPFFHALTGAPLVGFPSVLA